MLFGVECCRCWSVMVLFGNVVLAGVQSPILFILECCSMVEVGRVWSWRPNPIQCFYDPIQCHYDPIHLSKSILVCQTTPTVRHNKTLTKLSLAEQTQWLPIYYWGLLLAGPFVIMQTWQIDTNPTHTLIPIHHIKPIASHLLSAETIIKSS